VKRSELDAFAKHYNLGTEGVEAAFAFVGARPSRNEVQAFIARSLTIAGALLIAAGVVFFVAANWQSMGIYGRFVLVELFVLLTAALAIRKPPPRIVGRAALLLAFIGSGALFALFGQTYQTGADLYELFVIWALLGLPFAFAASWGPLWGAWLLVLNTALGLIAGFRPDGLLGAFFSSGELAHSELAICILTNLALWAVFTNLSGVANARWVSRLALTAAFGFACWAGVLATFGGIGMSDFSLADFLMLALVVGLCVGVARHALLLKADIYPLSLVAGTTILLVTTGLGRLLVEGGLLTLALLAAWLIVSSTIAARRLMEYSAEWRLE
jgi:hypothetical protein